MASEIAVQGHTNCTLALRAISMCRTEAIGASSPSSAMTLEEQEQPTNSDSSSSSSSGHSGSFSSSRNAPSKEDACTPPTVQEQAQDLLTTQRRPFMRDDTLSRPPRRRAAVIAVAGVVLVVVVGLRLGCGGDFTFTAGLLKARPDMYPAVTSVHEGRGSGSKRRALGELFRKLLPGGQRARDKGKRANRKRKQREENGKTTASDESSDDKVFRDGQNGDSRESHSKRWEVLKAEERTAKDQANAAQLKRKRQGKVRAKAGKAGRKASISGPVATGNDVQVNDNTRSKRAKLQALWKRLSIIGDGSGKRRSAGNDRSAREHRAWLLEELREEVQAYPGDLLQRAKAVRHELNDHVLIRYLEFAYWTTEFGGEPLVHSIDRTITWRETAAPHLITDKNVMEEAAYGKLYVRGHDREGRPIIYFNPGQERSFDTEKGLLLLYHTLERAAALLPPGQTQFAVVADCAGFGPSKTPPVAMIKSAFYIMQHHYPMRLGYVMIVNAGSPIVFAWKLISHVLSARTHEKIDFLSPKEAEARLRMHIDPATLPSTLPGGRDPFRFNNEVYFSR